MPTVPTTPVSFCVQDPMLVVSMVTITNDMYWDNSFASTKLPSPNYCTADGPYATFIANRGGKCKGEVEEVVEERERRVWEADRLEDVELAVGHNMKSKEVFA